MSNLQMDVSKGGLTFGFRGTYAEEHEAFVHSVIVAMTEGLEGNGFTVDASMTLNTTFRIGSPS